MTVCIAALCKYEIGGRSFPLLTLAADRMITNRERREYELRDQTKLVWLDAGSRAASVPQLHAEKVAVLMSGQIDSLLVITTNSWRRIADEDITSIPDMVGILVDEFHQFRRDYVERLYLRKYNLTIDTFVSRQKDFDRTFFERIEKQIDDPESDIGDLLVAGLDDDGGHIYTIHDPGIDVPCTGTGFAAIGMGEDEAETVFTSALYTPNFDWLQGLTLTYFAKKIAEMSPGVGPNTDLWFISANGNRYIPPLSNTVLKLGELYKKRSEERRAALIDDAKALGIILLEGQDAEVIGPEPGEEEETEDAPNEEGLPDGSQGREPQD